MPDNECDLQIKQELRKWKLEYLKPIRLAIYANWKFVIAPKAATERRPAQPEIRGPWAGGTFDAKIGATVAAGEPPCFGTTLEVPALSVDHCHHARAKCDRCTS